MSTVLMMISLLGGLAMFLYGMEIMGDGLKQGSGATLKNVLGKLTQNTIMGLITGTLVTAIIQSSTATIVLTVGLIGAGVLNLRQAASIVMGANIGTTVTAQLIRLMDIESSGDSLLVFFKPDTLAPVALVIGIILVMFIKKQKLKPVGDICMGFGILFMGLMLMTDAVEPLAESQTFIDAIAYFTDMPMVGIVTGLVMTVIVQSSSAMVGILQALSSTGVMTFELVYPIIMGINLGTCVTTAMVCSIGTGKDAKRTGVVHILFNSIGTVLFMVAMTALRGAGFMSNLWTSVVNSGGIANFQTVFNLITALILVPFTGLLVKASCTIVKEDPPKEDRYPELAAMDRNLMIAPTVALGAASRTVAAMARCARLNLERGLEQLLEWSDQRSADIVELEGRMDQAADDMDHYLVELSRHVEAERDNSLLNMLLQTSPDLERIGDYADNLNEMAEKMHGSGHSFSDSARQEMKILGDAVLEIIRLTIDALETDDATTIKRIEPLEEVIDDMVLMLKDRHTARLRAGRCTVDTGLVFMETLTYMERASDQCSSIAMLALGRHDPRILKDQHAYLAALHESGESSYVAEEANRRAQYLEPLSRIEF